MEDLFRSLIWDALVRAVISRLFAAVPFLAWGPIGLIMSTILTALAGRFYDAVREFIVLEAISIRNDAHRRAFDDASVKLKIIARDKGIDSPEFLEARNEQKKRLSEFVHFA